MASRKLNALELKLHQGALSSDQNVLLSKDAETLIPDRNQRIAALNFLLGVGLLKLLKHANGAVSYRAVTKQEVDVKKDLSGEEAMVLSHIQASGNEGIWVKHLKSKTELHQAIIDRCLKSLSSKQIIKDSKSHEHPTRKIYMLYHLTPSSKLTGGPWYTDNELDTEFIKHLSDVCLHFVKERSFPKLKKSADTSALPLYPIGANNSYPSSKQIQQFLQKSKITETSLSIEHVEQLLNVLVLDGEIEKVPSFGLAMWDSSIHGEDLREDDEEERESYQTYKRRRANQTDNESSASDSEITQSTKRTRNRLNDDKSDTVDDEIVSKKLRSLKGTLSDDARERGVSRKRLDTRQSPRIEKANDLSENQVFETSSQNFEESFVYRAIRQERIGLGWSQAPCGGCTVFEFCKDIGPVNPSDCHYYAEWLDLETVPST